MKIKIITIIIVILTTPIWLGTFLFNFIKNLIKYIYYSIIGLYNVPRSMIISIEHELYLLSIERKMKKTLKENK